MPEKNKQKFFKLAALVLPFFLAFSLGFAGFACSSAVSQESEKETESASESAETVSSADSAQDTSTETAIVSETSAVDQDSAETSDLQEETASENMALIIESPAFSNNKNIPEKYSCEGDNINPQLDISGVAGEVESLVLIVDDPDAPGGTWVHWTVFNISPDTTMIAEDSVPEGSVEGVTDFGAPGYGGPCPPSGTHRYFFKLFALDIKLNLSSDATADDIAKAMEGHIISSAELTGLYSQD